MNRKPISTSPVVFSATLIIYARIRQACIILLQVHVKRTIRLVLNFGCVKKIQDKKWTSGIQLSQSDIKQRERTFLPFTLQQWVNRILNQKLKQVKRFDPTNTLQKLNLFQ